jgi:hypothetical protein
VGTSFGKNFGVEKGDVLTPTAVPKKKRRTQREARELAKDDSNPNRDVKKSVALKAALRPRRSES